MLSADQLPGILWKRKVTWLVTFVLVVGAAAGVIASLDKIYTTRAFLLVSTGAAGSSFEAVQTNQVVTKSYSELLQTRNLAERVSRRLSFPISPVGLQNSVEIAPVTESQLITIEASATSPEQAAEIATTYARTFIEESRRFVAGQQTAARPVLAEPAPVISNPTRPRPKLYLLIASLLAAMLASGVAVLRHRTDQRLELDPGTTELEGLQILGRIPRTGSGSTVHASLGLDGAAPDRGVEEAFRFVLANLSFAAGGRRPASLAVVSAGQSEGKSTACASIGRAAMEQGVETLLVDGDLRRPRLTSALGLLGTEHSGFSTFLISAEPMALSEAARPVTGTSLSVLPSGPLPPNPPALLGSQALVDFEDRAKRIYELTIFDTPPLTVGADASLISAQVEGVVLVIDAERTRRGPMRQVIEQLRRANANVLGVVVNRADAPIASYYGFEEPTSRRRGRRRGDGKEAPAAEPVEAGG